MGVLARNYEKIYFRENVVETKNLPPYFPISLVRTKKKKNRFFGPKKKVLMQKIPKVHTAEVGTCSRLCAESQKVLSRHFRENTIHVSMGVLADIVFFFRLQYGKPLASIPGNHWETNTIFFFFLASFFLQRLKNCFLPVFFDILV